MPAVMQQVMLAPGGVAGGVAIQFLGAAVHTAATNMSFGAEAADRHILVVCRWQRGATPANNIVQVRVNSVVATLDANSLTGSFGGGGSAVNQGGVAIALVALPTGTSGPVAMQTGVGVYGTVHVYRVTGLNSATPVDTTATAAYGTCSDTIDVQAGGVLVVATSSYRPGASVATVVGTTTAYGAFENAANYYSEDGVYSPAVTESGRTISLGFGGTTAYIRTIMVAASYR